MFNNLPETIKYKEHNKKKLITLAFISILWIFSLSTSTVANILFYDAKLEEKLEVFTIVSPQPKPPLYFNYPNSEEGHLNTASNWAYWVKNFGKCKLRYTADNFSEQGIDTLKVTPNLVTIINLSEDVIRGNALKKVKPLYPSLARESKVSGTVEVHIIIDEKGEVISAIGIKGDKLLQQAALRAAKKWKFSPTLSNGTPIKAQGILTFVFIL
ncbi:MAG: energy transducer TonB [Acidobacteria bacterium]|nr:energy transducer TonB [Acidobacteriota bacterium]